MIRLRKVDVAEYGDTIRLLERWTFPDDDPEPLTGDWWVATVEDALHGELCVGFCALKYAGYGSRGFLAAAGVLPAHRRRGLHRRMIRVRERAARALGYERLITYTAPDNLASANSLIRAGYLLYRPKDEWGVRGALYLYKDL